MSLRRTFFRFCHLSQLTAFFVRSPQRIWLCRGCGVEGGGESPTLRWIFVVVVVGVVVIVVVVVVVEVVVVVCVWWRCRCWCVCCC